MSKVQIVERILLQEVKQLIKERCALLGYIPNEIPKGTFNESQEYKIKIAGDYTLLRDTAIWRELNENNKFKELELSQIEIEIIVFRFLKQFYNNKSNEIKEITKQIQNNKQQLLNIDNSISDLAKYLLSI